MKEEFTKFNLEDYLTTDELRKEYLNQVLADGDIEEFKRALFYIAKSKGIEKVAKKANLNRESFYKMFKENSKPRFESIFKVVNALDIKLVYA
ncbi:MAG: putative addiction module antidote protein [Campylobacter sp.]|jgi:probable addiction module antidote protein|uniref:addiction module antidote protein n=1 Tax=Campylobacter concisus TaxID=199 RepID=UPI000CD8C8E3|nr:addiction module antidote protein [Campylobacter concisus]MDO4875744.1 putative addiction module antidote protein [Campylobacter sp.]